MRAMTVLAALSSAAILAGCATNVEIDGERLRCENKHVNVINQPGRIEVRPERIEVCRGFSLALRFRNRVPPGDAHTRPAAAGATWLEAENTSEDGIDITVDKDARRGTEFKYTIEIKGLGSLDPRIVIQ